MLPLLLQPLHHRGEEHIAIRFSSSQEITEKVKTLPKARWSRTHQCWYVPLAQEHYAEIRQRLSSLAIIDARSLCQYLDQRKAVQPLVEEGKPLSLERAEMRQTSPLSESNLQAFARFQEKLRLTRSPTAIAAGLCTLAVMKYAFYFTFYSMIRINLK